MLRWLSVMNLETREHQTAAPANRRANTNPTRPAAFDGLLPCNWNRCCRSGVGGVLAVTDVQRTENRARTFLLSSTICCFCLFVVVVVGQILPKTIRWDDVFLCAHCDCRTYRQYRFTSKKPAVYISFPNLRANQTDQSLQNTITTIALRSSSRPSCGRLFCLWFCCIIAIFLYNSRLLIVTTHTRSIVHVTMTTRCCFHVHRRHCMSLNFSGTHVEFRVANRTESERDHEARYERGTTHNRHLSHTHTFQVVIIICPSTNQTSPASINKERCVGLFFLLYRKKNKWDRTLNCVNNKKKQNNLKITPLICPFFVPNLVLLYNNDYLLDHYKKYDVTEIMLNIVIL